MTADKDATARRSAALVLSLVSMPFVQADVTAGILTGRVVDSAGEPVAGAEIRIFRKVRSADDTAVSNEPVKFDGANVLLTGSDGRYATLDIFDQDTPLRTVALAEGMLAGRSGWITPGDQATVEVRDIVLRRLRSVSGRVVDRVGTPVVGATVFNTGDAHQRLETQSDAEGRFQLAGVPEGRAFLFAEEPGFRFKGQLLAARDKSAEIVLVRPGEDIEPLGTLPPPLSDEEREKLAREAVAPYFDLALRKGSDRDKFWALYASPIFDPIETFDRLSEVTFGDPVEQAYAQEQMIREWIDRQSTSDWDEVESLITSIPDENTVSFCYLYAVRAMASAERVRQVQWVDRSLLHARRIYDAAWRTIGLARIGQALFDLGDTDRAAPLIAEAHKLVEQIPKTGIGRHAVGTVARALARTDLAAALALLDMNSDDRQYASQAAELAVSLVDRNPDAAERVWKQAAQRNRADGSDLASRDYGKSALLCRKMARIDPERAGRIARAIQTRPWPIFSLGAIAEVLADADPAAARQLLRDVFAGDVPPPSREPQSVYVRETGAIVVAWLLPIAERVDPELGHEYFWRALALRWDRPTVERLDDETEWIDVELAAMLARYNREIAGALLEPYLTQFSEFAAPTRDAGPAELLAALATIDPRRAARLLDRLPPPATASYGELQNYARATVARLLGARGKIYWREAGYLDLDWYNTW